MKAYRCDGCGQIKMGEAQRAILVGKVLIFLRHDQGDYCVPCLLKNLISNATSQIEELKAAKKLAKA